MFRSVICIMLCLMMFIKGASQSLAQSAISMYSYHSPSTDKPSWQRLNLWLSSSYFYFISAGPGLDSSLLYVSSSLGISSLAIVAEGIDDPELIKQSQWFDQRNPVKGVRLLSQLKGRRQLELMILLGAYYAFQPNSYKQYKDSVEYFLMKAIDQSKAMNEERLGRVARCLLGKIYGQGADVTHSGPVFDRLINDCKIHGDKRTEARALFYRSIYTVHNATATGKQPKITDIINEKIEGMEKAGKIYHELGDVESEIVTAVISGYYHMYVSRLEEAYPILIKAYQLENSIGYPYIHYTADNIAMLTSAQGKFGEPLKYSLEAVKLSEAVRDSVGWTTFYTRLGMLYYTEGERNEESLKWMLKAHQRYIGAKDADLYMNLINVTEILIDQGKPDEALEMALSISKKVPPINSQQVIYQKLVLSGCYIGTKQYNLAEQATLSADSMLKKEPYLFVNSSYQGTMITTQFASIYFFKGQFEKSRKYYEQYLRDSSRLVALAADLMAYEKLIKIDSVFEDDASAVKHYKQYVALRDSNFRISKVRQAEELEVMFETKKKEDQIASLQQEAKIEKANLKQATLIKNMTIAGVIAALIIAGLLYRQNRIKQKNNKVITQKNEQLQHYLDEKEWLLKEIHHRVKNNLQIVMSLLNSQSAYIDNESALTAIHDSQHRVHAMSLIHQKLYGSQNVSSIDISIYIRELGSYLADSFGTGQKIRFDYAIEPLEMDVSQAVPLGLILNEAITNSLKYAFPNNRSGVISITLAGTSLNQYLLMISDNGVGMSLNSTDKKNGSLGMSLMHGLSEDLNGSFSIENKNGTTIIISFILDIDLKHRNILASQLFENN